MTDHVEYIELHRRDPMDAITNAGMEIMDLKIQLREIREAAGLADDTPHSIVLEELTADQRVAPRSTAKGFRRKA